MLCSVTVSQSLLYQSEQKLNEGATRIKGVLLTGSVGVGKTTLAVEMSKVLGDNGARVVVIDLDWLGWLDGFEIASPELSELICDNVRAVWNNFKRREPTHVILCRFVHRREEVERLRASVPDVEVVVARVVASGDTIQKRLGGRDVGAELEEHLTEATRMTKLLDEANLTNLQVVNDDRDIREVALQALRSLTWSPTGAPEA